MLMVWQVIGVTDARRPMFRMTQMRPSGYSSALSSRLSEISKLWKACESSDECSSCTEGMLPSDSWTLCSNSTGLTGKLRTSSSYWSKYWLACTFWAFWLVAPGLTQCTRCYRAPGTGTRYRVPVWPVPVLRGPGVTGECSECTGRLTDDCWTAFFVADRSDRLLTEGLSTGHFDSDQGDLFYNSMPKKESPSVGGVPGVTGAPGVTGCTWSDPVYPVYPVPIPGTGLTGTPITGSRYDRWVFRVHQSVDQWLLNWPFRSWPVRPVARRRSVHWAFWFRSRGSILQ